MREFSTDDHVSDSDSDKLLIKPFETFLVNEKFDGLWGFTYQTHPDICFERVRDVFRLIVVINLIELIELKS